MEHRNRNIQMRFWVTSEEKKLIRRKMYMAKTNNMGAYLRKMAIDGTVANVDMTYQKEMFQEMHKIGVNVNQLAKVANTTGAATPEDIVEVKGMLDNLWHILKRDAQWIKEQ